MKANLKNLDLRDACTTEITRSLGGQFHVTYHDLATGTAVFESIAYYAVLSVDKQSTYSIYYDVAIPITKYHVAMS